MPSTKPRLTITLEAPVYDAIADLADARHVSKATVIRDFLSAAAPIIERTAKLIRHAEAVTGTAATDYAASLDRAQTAIETMMGQMLEALEEAEKGTGDDGAGSGLPGADAAAAVPSQDPLPLTGGSTFQKAQGNQRVCHDGNTPQSGPRKAS